MWAIYKNWAISKFRISQKPIIFGPGPTGFGLWIPGYES